MRKIVIAVVLMMWSLRPAVADVVSISSSVPTAIISSGMFNSKTIALEANGIVYLNSQPIISTAAFQSASFSITSSSGIVILPNFHGTIYGEAAAGSAVNLYYLGGQ
jgi:hypothetical protein